MNDENRITILKEETVEIKPPFIIMKPFEIIKTEEEKLKEAIRKSIKEFQEVTGVRINYLEYYLEISETQCGEFVSDILNCYYDSELSIITELPKDK